MTGWIILLPGPPWLLFSLTSTGVLGRDTDRRQTWLKKDVSHVLRLERERGERVRI